jgi:hypothetical protein
MRKWLFFGDSGYLLSRVAIVDLLQREAADRVFADAAEVKSAVMLDDVGDFGEAVGGAVLEVFDDAALRV